MTAFSITVTGPAVGKGRPRFANGHTYTDKPTEIAEAAIQRAWENDGCPKLEGPVWLKVMIFLPRPKGHYKANGGLSAEGQRNPYPGRQKPDLDNALKLVMDALNKRAWEDDVRIVEAIVQRKWGAYAYTWISAHEVATAAEGRVAA